MKLGSAGEAFFVHSTNQIEPPAKEEVTSPIQSEERKQENHAIGAEE